MAVVALATNATRLEPVARASAAPARTWSSFDSARHGVTTTAGARRNDSGIPAPHRSASRSRRPPSRRTSLRRPEGCPRGARRDKRRRAADRPTVSPPSSPTRAPTACSPHHAERRRHAPCACDDHRLPRGRERRASSSSPAPVEYEPAVRGDGREDERHPSVPIRSIRSSANRSPSRSSATLPFGGPKCSRPRQSTFVRPQLGPVLHRLRWRHRERRRDRDRRGARRTPDRASAIRRGRDTGSGGTASRSPSTRRPSTPPCPLHASLRVRVRDQRAMRDVEPDHRRIQARGKIRCAASGSAQMLNSAAGVRLPSPTAPPISTIRSGTHRGAARTAGRCS